MVLIKSIKDFSTLAHAEPVSWNAPVISNDNSVGPIIFPPDADVIGYEGQWLVLISNGNGAPMPEQSLWVIKSVTPNENSITVTVQDAFNAFYRSHIMPLGYTTTGALLAALFNINYKNQADTEYAMPYLTVSNTDSTPLIPPDLTDDTIFVMCNYLRKVSQRGVKIKISLAGNGTGVAVDISTINTPKQTLIMGDGHSQLVSQDFSSNITSKVTVVIGGVNNYYYLQADGSISTTAPSPRIAGKWETIVLREDGDALEEATKIFEKNSAALKIEFYSDKLLEYCAPVTIVADGHVSDANISFIGISSDDYRYHYIAGDMPVTLLDKLKLALNR